MVAVGSWRNNGAMSPQFLGPPLAAWPPDLAPLAGLGVGAPPRSPSLPAAPATLTVAGDGGEATTTGGCYAHFAAALADAAAGADCFARACDAARASARLARLLATARARRRGTAAADPRATVTRVVSEAPQSTRARATSPLRLRRVRRGAF